MKRRIFALAMVLVIAFGLLIPAAAFEDHNYLYVAVSDMDNQRFVEQGETTLPVLSDQPQCSLRVDIVDSTEDETLEDYAQIFYDQYGYGDDHDGNGALLMIQVEELGGSVEPEAPAEPEPAAVPAVTSVKASEAAAEQSFIIDEAGLLTQSQWLKLENSAQKAAEKYGCGVYVLTVETMNGAERRDFAKDYYASHKLGVGEFQNGILFLVCMDTREYVTITYGRNPNKLTEYGPGILAFTDEGIAAMEEDVVSKLSDGDYNGAFDAYLTVCNDYLSYYAEHGEGMVPTSVTSILIRLAIVIFVPLLIAFLVCGILKRQMKTARAATAAGDYIPADSFRLSWERDQYTHTTTTRRKIEQESSSGSSSVDSDGFGGSKGGHF